MNIVFFGSGQFGLQSLKALGVCGHEVRCVVTQPDTKKGRGLKLNKTPIKEFAQLFGLDIYQPEKINTSPSADFLKKLSPDLFIVIAYGQILSQDILNIPKIMAINVHSSLLPHYRGAAPINWAIINGERETGVTIIKMAEEMDAGDIILQKKININAEDNFLTLENKLELLSQELLLETLDLIGNNNYKLTPQDETKKTFAPKLKKEDGLIKWQNSAISIYNQIRGCLNWPSAFTYYKGKILKILKAKVFQMNVLSMGQLDFTEERIIPGQITAISKHGIFVAAGRDILAIEELQIEGGRKMTTSEFIAGHKIQKGETLGK